LRAKERGGRLSPEATDCRAGSKAEPRRLVKRGPDGALQYLPPKGTDAPLA